MHNVPQPRRCRNGKPTDTPWLDYVNKQEGSGPASLSYTCAASRDARFRLQLTFFQTHLRNFNPRVPAGHSVETSISSLKTPPQHFHIDQVVAGVYVPVP